MNDEFERMWNKAIFSFKLMSQNYLKETAEAHQHLSQSQIQTLNTQNIKQPFHPEHRTVRET
jgi:hypothetical protein